MRGRQTASAVGSHNTPSCERKGRRDSRQGDVAASCKDSPTIVSQPSCGSDRTQQECISRCRHAWLDPSGIGVAVPAVRGSCVAFFTRSASSDGAIDPFSWHGGASVNGTIVGCSDVVTVPEVQPHHRTGKWTLQKFREMPTSPGLELGQSDGKCTEHAFGIEEFARRHTFLNTGCCGDVWFDVVDT